MFCKVVVNISKLTSEDKKAIVKKNNKGINITDIAKEYNVNYTTISRIIKKNEELIQKKIDNYERNKLAEKMQKPNIYDTNIQPKLQFVQKWKEKGFTNKEIAKKLNVGYSTFNKYLSECIELKEVLESGNTVFIDDVENALYKIALGYDAKEVKSKITDRGTTKEVITRHIPPDREAIKFILRNRTSDWSNNEKLDKQLKREQRENLQANTELVKKKAELLNKAESNGILDELIKEFNEV